MKNNNDKLIEVLLRLVGGLTITAVAFIYRRKKAKEKAEKEITLHIEIMDKLNVIEKSVNTMSYHLSH